MSEDQSGRVLNQRYELTLRIGEGTTGDVYRAWAPNLHRYVAVKLLKPDVVAKVGWEEAIGRFEREARSGGQLASGHAVKVTDFDFDAELGYPYIVMEHLEGVDLATHLKRVGRLSVTHTATVLDHVGDVMAEAHAKGIVHRDLKPEHIFLVWSRGGRFTAKVIDFSIAKWLAQGSMRTEVLATWSGTQLGAVLGTLQYMSPEQLRGEAVDHRTDLWAMAVIAYECLLGENPFPLVTSADPTVVIAAITVAICEKPLPVPSERGAVPDGFDAWFARGVARDLSQRFQSVREATDALRAVLEGELDGAEELVAAPRVEPLTWGNRHGHQLAIFLPVAVALTGVVGFWLGRLVGRADVANASDPAVFSNAPMTPPPPPATASDSEPGVPISDLPVELPVERDAVARSPSGSARPIGGALSFARRSDQATQADAAPLATGSSFLPGRSAPPAAREPPAEPAGGSPAANPATWL